MRKAIFIFLILEQTICAVGFGQTHFVNTTFPYPLFSADSAIKTIKIYPLGNETSYPIMNLNNKNNRIVLNFDDLNNDPRDFKYRLIHCGSDWKKSPISFYDFAQGLPDDYLTNYEFSQNFGLQYIHFSVAVPNNQIQFLISGNYIIEVFEESNPDKVIVTAGFMVVENKVSISSNAHRAMDADKRYSGQEIDFSIKPNNYHIVNPYTDLKTIVLQSFNLETALSLQPLFVKPEELDYDYGEENVFQGGNEYRELDLRRLSVSRYMASVDRTGKIPVFRTLTQEKRAFINYKNEPDINGQFALINDDLLFNSELEAEYVQVDVKLNYNYEIEEGVFLFGKFSNWQFLPEYKMEYNREERFYYKSIFLKQGYYNYLFAIKNSKDFGAFAEYFWDIEGSHHETENNYLILVYHKRPGTYYESLIGTTTINYPAR